MRRLMWCAVLVALVSAAASAAVAKKVRSKGPEAGQYVKLRANGSPTQGSALLVKGVLLVPVGLAVQTMRVAPPGVKVGSTEQGEVTLTRPEATVRVRPGTKQMYVDGQARPLSTPAAAGKGGAYVPVEVLKALYPEYAISLSYDAKTRTALLAYQPAVRKVEPVRQAAAPVVASRPQPQGGAACAPSSGGAGVATQEFGKPGAKVEILALLPITHGCHVRTEAELKKAQQQHPEDVHLVIVDLFGSEAGKYLPQVGGWQRAVVSIDGKTTFTVQGRHVQLERMEGGSYEPSEIGAIVENELRGS